jgi:hypothetical protein
MILTHHMFESIPAIRNGAGSNGRWNHRFASRGGFTFFGNPTSTPKFGEFRQQIGLSDNFRHAVGSLRPITPLKQRSKSKYQFPA